MNKILLVFSTIVILTLSAFTVYESTSWEIGEKFTIEFVGDNPSGVFNELEGDIVFDPNDLAASSFNMRIPVGSINTGNGMRNKHAKAKDWFNAKEYPNITFVSSNISRTNAGYEVTGKLNMAGNEKEIVIPFTFENNYFTGDFTVNRLEYNIGTTKGMKGQASDKFVLNITVPVTKK